MNMPSMFDQSTLSRRDFIRRSSVAAAVLLLAHPLETLASLSKSHAMSFLHTHTGERLIIDYSPKGCSSSSLSNVNRFLRDFRTGEVCAIDPLLLDILYALQIKSGSTGTIEIVSGYRSPHTNRMLRSKSSGVASRSLHLQGKALDFRIAGTKTKRLRDIAVSLQKGGVGYYAKSDFIHIDTGRVRTW